MAQSAKAKAAAELNREAVREAMTADAKQRLQELAHELRGTVNLYVEKDGAHRLLVSVSRTSPWILRPYKQVVIEPSEAESGYRLSGRINAGEGGVFSVDGVISICKSMASEFLIKRSSAPYEPPDWYTKAGMAMGVPAFVLVWLLLALVGGWLGLLMGWLPGLIALMLARALWLPGVLLLAGLAVTHL
jgi:hypothetical protein